MAITTRYFSTSSAGAADGTSWANRAQLINAGTWSSVITGFNFSGSDTLLCLIGPGTYTVTAALASGLFANAPTVANRLMFHGCDSSGVRLVPPLGWSSAQADWDTSGLPVFNTTTNVPTFNLANFAGRMLSITASAATSVIGTGLWFDWCYFSCSTSDTTTNIIANVVLRVYNSILKMTGASFRAAALISANRLRNCRIINGGGATSGNRHGIEFTGTGQTGIVEFCTIAGFQGDGIGTSASTTTAALASCRRCVIANCSGNGMKLNGTASQTVLHEIHSCMITGNGSAAIDGQSAALVLLSTCRVRNNGSGVVNLSNAPTDWDVDTSAGTDAAEYVDSANNDFRIKYKSTFWGKGVGVSDQLPTVAQIAVS